MGKIWKGREATVKIADSVTIDTSAALDTFFSSGTEISADLKDFEIAEPEMAGEKIDLVGEDTDGFQNADWDDKPAGLGAFKGTLVLRGDETLEPHIYGTGTAIASTHTRYRVGDGNTIHPAILINFDDGTKEVNFVVDNTRLRINSTKLAADGHAEYDVEGYCLARDFYKEFKD